MIRQLSLMAMAAIMLVQLSCAPTSYQKTDSEAVTTIAMATESWQRSSGTALPAVDDLMQRLFDGETLALMHHLINERGISGEEIDELREMLARLEAESDESSD